jgi:hypothetical protein
MNLGFMPQSPFLQVKNSSGTMEIMICGYEGLCGKDGLDAVPQQRGGKQTCCEVVIT